MFMDAGKTFKQLASQLRRSAEADRRGSGRKPLPGRAHGEPDEFSFRAAAAQDRMADFFERLSQERDDQHATKEDISSALALR